MRDRLQVLEERCSNLMVWLVMTGLLSVAAGVVAVVGMVAPPSLKTLRLQSLVIVDDKGEERIILRALRDGAEFKLDSGKLSIVLAANRTIASQTIGDGEEGIWLSHMLKPRRSSLVGIRGDDSKPRVALTVDDDEGFVHVDGPHGKPSKTIRAQP